ncbi:thiamine pyrophosphate-dependent dehydrogenase E1 component subunit alpha [Actinophytocola algeriensis]|uniref:Pyruvate dehydrogenase E1 component alpha subunit n=1 Tax=Actinophytocola algeriensis TaxID=1768010 RepID=A0A7W7QC90_9PSEU|nr:thiamine pyrophosphate-dependent dehydrogenase E1 component subunit alpha [Actinophytocola algeriensis]MBB4910914.1 pyruvate dehydrogenase E1 component alpha subunit [Actinophytocola algeriensis]MBE1473907.1 pyruvate dehydrogenase E1 component alpha subunit [Actinophytocola algeriensis]
MTVSTEPTALPAEFACAGGRELAMEMMRRMQRVRLFEEATKVLFHAGELPAMVHLSIGQEAAVVGACLATGTSDYMTGNHRSHGHPIAKGARLDALMAELLGKATGVCGGKGGSMHLADFSVGSLGESGIVGSAIPVATGAALAAQVRGSGQVALCFFGDGAASEGVLHESMNMASIWKLPVVYFCENNGYAVSVTAEESLSVPDVSMRAAGYSMPGVTVDGQDVLAVYRATAEAVRRARAGEGPSLVEAKTYRFHEHAYGLQVPTPYRDQSVVDSWFATVDPLTLFHDRLVAWDVATSQELDALRAEVRSEVDAAVEFARVSPFPPPEAAYTDVYKEVTA